MVERHYDKTGKKVAVLVSYGYGAGWSTWYHGEAEEPFAIAIDKRVVEFWLQHRDDAEYLKALDAYKDNDVKRAASELFRTWGYEDVYFGGFDHIELRWVKAGTLFRIDEYDGAEGLVTLDDEVYCKA